jgi:hypothetical protein
MGKGRNVVERWARLRLRLYDQLIRHRSRLETMAAERTRRRLQRIDEHYRRTEAPWLLPPNWV